MNKLCKKKMEQASGAEGKHCIGEIYGANSDLLNDEEFICKSLREAAMQSGATLLKIGSHKFHPQGVTAFALLAESHISIHTWPELQYANLDAFTCGSHTDPEKAFAVLKKIFEATSSHSKTIKRTYFG
jgi:S-adenosylmethionine decarboxylase